MCFGIEAIKKRGKNTIYRNIQTNCFSRDYSWHMSKSEAKIDDDDTDNDDDDNS